MSAGLRLSLLGPFEARLSPGPAIALPAKSRALLAYLALSQRTACTREGLAALLWGDTGDAQARQSLRKALSGLRRALNRGGVTAIVVTRRSVILDPAVVKVDVRRFDALVRRGTPEALATAVALYRGDLLAGLALDEAPLAEWLVVERGRRREAALNALTRLLAYQARTGARTAAVDTATRLLALDPLHEPGHRALMRLYVAGGLRAVSLRQYQTCVDLLQAELGVEPEAETRRLYAEILREPSIDPAPARDALARRVPADDPAPFVGREAESARISHAIAAAAGGEARVVAIRGEAGIGKSRLLAHACADASARGLRVVVGRAHPTEQILPFGPWMDAFRTGGVARDPVLRRQRKTAWRAELARLLPELGARPPGEDPARLFEAVATLLTELAVRQPLLLALEDLHWADDLSLRLLAFLRRRLSDHPIVFVLTVREENLTDAVVLRSLLRDLDGARGTVTLLLGPLSHAETAALVRALARVAEPATVGRLVEQIWQVSEGNPLMAVETVRAVEQGMPSAASDRLPIAERVREVILARLERVSERGRHLLDFAATIGRDFTFPLLQRASGVDEAAAAAGVEELVRRRVLRLAGDAFQFTHDRIREVVYAEVLAPRRRVLNRRVAEVMETLHAAAWQPAVDEIRTLDA